MVNVRGLEHRPGPTVPAMAQRKWFRSRALDFTAAAATAPRFVAADPRPGPTFSIDIAPEVFGLESYGSLVAPVGRDEAMQVGAVERSRNLICGRLGGLQYELLDEETRETIPSSLLRQPELGVPRSVTLINTFEDLFFRQVAWWQVTEWETREGGVKWPAHVVRLDPTTVDVTKEGRVYRTAAGHTGMATEWLEDSELIRFDSPNDGLLRSAARDIRIAAGLATAASSAAEGVPPVDYFTPADGIDPADDDEVVEILDAWATARRKRRTGYVPAALQYNTAGWNPEQLELSEQRQHAVLEIARHAGIDPEDLGVSTTSRTYQNDQDRRRALLDDTLGAYLHAFEDRLSMDDIARPGTIVRADTADFLRSDDKTRMETYKTGLEVGAWTKPEIRKAENKAPLEDAEQPAPVRTLEAAPAASGATFLQFDGADVVQMEASTLSFAVDRERRTISGLAVPYGVPGKSLGQWWQFSQGTLTYADAARVKLWINHDPATACGFAMSLDDRPDGLYVVFKVARGPEGDKALSMAEDKVWDGLSIGVKPGGKYRRDKAGVNHAIESPLMEISLTPAPSFDGARVHDVAASAAPNITGGSTMRLTPEQRARLAELRAKNGRNAEEETELTELTGLALDEAQAATDDADDAEGAEGDGEGIASAVAAGIRSAAASFGTPAPARQAVPAGRPTGNTHVREEKPYRFGGEVGKHDFSSDIIAALRDQDSTAQQRVVSFMAEEFPTGPRFDVASADVASLNPAKNRPEMYVDNLEFLYPLYDAYYSGGLEDATPFTFPKFVSAADATADHAEGVEPDAMGFVATSQTVTPTPTSGKAEIPREIWDAGGNPKVSDLMWKEMQRSWFEGLEAKTEDLLAAATPGVGGFPAAWALTAGAVDSALVKELQRKLVGLQFVRGGNRFDKFHGHVDLFTNLSDATDDMGRPLLPMINPANAQGTSAEKFAYLSVGGQRLDPAWALGPTADAASKSYLGCKDDVHVWASAPKRLQFESRVAFVDVGIWGYKATAMSRPAGLQVVTYDPLV